MRSRRPHVIKALTTVALVACTLVPLVPATAQVLESVTLEASKEKMAYGATVKLKGQVSSLEANEEITIVDENGGLVAETITIEDGRYVVSLQPKHNMTLTAEWNSATSDPVEVMVRPLLHARIAEVRLFDKARVAGSLTPAHDGQNVKVKILRNGNRFDIKQVKLDGSEFRMHFNVSKPGEYSAKVTFDDSDHLEAEDTTKKLETKLPNLSDGDKNIYVGLLEKRLDKLQYHLTGINNHFDIRTGDAVMAFNKVNGRSRVKTVDAGTWRALASPHKPKAKASTSGNHVEVDQTRQVFYLVKGSKIIDIVHVSTGAGGATRDGSFKIYKKGGAGAGYFPSYFDGARAFHAWNDVPPTNASHGCIRLPWWAAEWYWKHTPIGTPVRVYH